MAHAKASSNEVVLRMQNLPCGEVWENSVQMETVIAQCVQNTLTEGLIKHYKFFTVFVHISLDSQ